MRANLYKYVAGKKQAKRVYGTDLTLANSPRSPEAETFAKALVTTAIGEGRIVFPETYQVVLVGKDYTDIYRIEVGTGGLKVL